MAATPASDAGCSGSKTEQRDIRSAKSLETAACRAQQCLIMVTANVGPKGMSGSLQLPHIWEFYHEQEMIYCFFKIGQRVAETMFCTAAVMTLSTVMSSQSYRTAKFHPVFDTTIKHERAENFSNNSDISERRVSTPEIYTYPTIFSASPNLPMGLPPISPPSEPLFPVKHTTFYTLHTAQNLNLPFKP